MEKFMYLCALTAILSTFVQCDGSVKLVSLPIETESIEGLSHIMFCNLLQGTKPVYFEWTIDGKPLMNRSSSVIKVENQETFSLLKIRNLKRNHSAVYTCYGKNGRSMDSTSTRLIVQATIGHHCAIIGDNDDNGGNEH
ncbi:hypothetical protein BLOT_007007 [Blomia tropicalis]|nr:hypothetical protein BLOT_007007 [Blomia tropicalis]